jgi:uncharacterized membrane protein YtjA (UPF0391 family)
VPCLTNSKNIDRLVPVLVWPVVVVTEFRCHQLDLFLLLVVWTWLYWCNNHRGKRSIILAFVKYNRNSFVFSVVSLVKALFTFPSMSMMGTTTNIHIIVIIIVIIMINELVLLFLVTTTEPVF